MTTDRESPAITGRIRAYRAGEIPFATLLTELSERDYARPAHFDAHGDVREISEAADHFAPGTWGEVTRACDTGLLTGPEYEAIASGALRSHGA